MKLLLLHSAFALVGGFVIINPHIGLDIVAVIALTMIRCATMCHVAKQTRRHMASAVRTIADRACAKHAPAD